MLLYLGGFFFLFAVVFALPDLIEAARNAPPGTGEFTPEEIARSQEIWREALRGRIFLVFAAAFVATGLGIYARVLPGLRD